MNTRGVRFMPLVALALGAFGCSRETPYEQPPLPVTAGTVDSSGAGTSVRYSATARPNVGVTLAFKVAGYVDDILTRSGDSGRVRDVQQGDHVEKNAALARVRQSDYQQGVNQIKAGVAEATAAYDRAALSYERAQRLFAKQSLTKPELDDAKAHRDAMAAKVEGASAGLREAEIVLGDSVLRAPFSGVVLKRTVERGSLVSPGAPAFVLADTSSMKVVFGVPDVVVKQLRLGNRQGVTFDALPDTPFDGRVTAIAPSPDPATRAYEVEVTVPNPRGTIDVGFIATLLLTDQPQGSAVTVPLDAIVKPPSGAEYGVFALDGAPGAEVAKLRPVTLGAVVGNAVTVTAGLKGGERIILRGATLVKDGQRVRVLR